MSTSSIQRSLTAPPRPTHAELRNPTLTPTGSHDTSRRKLTPNGASSPLDTTTRAHVAAACSLYPQLSRRPLRAPAPRTAPRTHRRCVWTSACRLPPDVRAIRAAPSTKPSTGVAQQIPTWTPPHLARTRSTSLSHARAHAADPARIHPHDGAAEARRDCWKGGGRALRVQGRGRGMHGRFTRSSIDTRDTQTPDAPAFALAHGGSNRWVFGE